MNDKLVIKLKDDVLGEFNPQENKLEDVITLLNKYKDKTEEIKVITESLDTCVSESYTEDVPGKEWTVWSASDYAEAGEQIPLVKVVLNDDGEFEAIALSNDNFDQESFKIATNTLKATKGRPVKDILTRVDKSLNHPDPNLSTELARQEIIRATKGGEKKKDILDVVGKPSELQDVLDEEREVKLTDNDYNLQLLANQILVNLRDELKYQATKATTTEDKLAELFEEFTGVNYYTEEIVNKEQYKYILDLLGRSSNEFDESYVGPKDNPYIIKLKDLTEDLIEKVLLRQDPDFYKK